MFAVGRTFRPEIIIYLLSYRGICYMREGSCKILLVRCDWYMTGSTYTHSKPCEFAVTAAGLPEDETFREPCCRIGWIGVAGQTQVLIYFQALLDLCNVFFDKSFGLYRISTLYDGHYAPVALYRMLL